LSEERRLCYVAMTRAKTHLVLTWRREVSYFAGAKFAFRDAVRSRFLDVLVTKKKAKSSQGGVNPSGSNKSSIRKGFKSGLELGSMTKRQLHSEANRYLASGSEAWDDWEPSSRKNLIRKMPLIKPITVGGVDQRQSTPSSQSWNRPHHSGNKVGQMPSSPNYMNSSPNRGQTRASFQEGSRATSRIQGERPPQIVTKNGSVPKRPNQTTRRETARRGDNAASLRGEPPPEMDSTMFFPVGSPVKHNLHGRGIVRPPPSADKRFAEKLLVRVMFSEEGQEWDLPMDGLMHTYD